MQTHLQNFFNLFLYHENIKKQSSKVAHNRPQTFFSSTGLAAQTSPELIFHIIYMSQDPSVSLSVIKVFIFYNAVSPTYSKVLSYPNSLVFKLSDTLSYARMNMIAKTHCTAVTEMQKISMTPPSAETFMFS